MAISMKPTNEDRYLTVEQVMARLQVSRDTVIRLIKRKAIKAKKIGTIWRISEKSLNDYLTKE